MKLTPRDKARAWWRKRMERRAVASARGLRVWWRRLGFAVAPLPKHGPPVSMNMLLKKLYPAERMALAIPSFADFARHIPMRAAPAHRGVSFAFPRRGWRP